VLTIQVSLSIRKLQLLLTKKVLNFNSGLTAVFITN